VQVDVVIAEAGEDGAALAVVDGLAAAPPQGRGYLCDQPAADPQVGPEPTVDPGPG
jgi:hypothetical protein